MQPTSLDFFCRAQASAALVYDRHKTPFLISFEKMTEQLENVGLPGTETDDAFDVVRQDKTIGK